jgi:hypothetical protein
MIPVLATVTGYPYSLGVGANSNNREATQNMNTIEITVTGFNFETGEYTTHTETVELN